MHGPFPSPPPTNHHSSIGICSDVVSLYVVPMTANSSETTADEGGAHLKTSRETGADAPRPSFLRPARPAPRAARPSHGRRRALRGRLCAAARRSHQRGHAWTPRARQATVGGWQSGIPQLGQRAAHPARAASWRRVCGGSDHGHLEGRYGRCASRT
jgi:hypothetical protein